MIAESALDELASPPALASQPEADVVDRDLVLDELTCEQVLGWRARAAGPGRWSTTSTDMASTRHRGCLPGTSSRMCSVCPASGI